MSRLTVFMLSVFISSPAFSQDFNLTQDPFAQEGPAKVQAEDPFGKTEPIVPLGPVGSAAPTDVVDSAELLVPAEPEAEPVEVAPPTHPKSMPGIVKTVSDADENLYRVVVVQPLKLVSNIQAGYRQRFVPYSEFAAGPTGEQATVTKYRRESMTKSCNVLASVAESPVLIPLQANMPCFRLTDGMLSQANASELTLNTHLLLTHSIDDAMEIADSALELFNSQVAMTGIKPQLPGYILVLSSSVNEEHTKTFPERLQEFSPYLGSAEFFNERESQSADEIAGRNLQERRQFPQDMERAWNQARLDFFANRHGDSEQALNSLVQAKTQKPFVYYLRGLVRYNRGDSVGAELDFAEGAKLEAALGQRLDICRDLERVQGPARLALERHRRYVMN